MTRDTGGPAFPTELVNTNDGYIHQGMTLRDYFAAKAMQALLDSDRYPGVIEVNHYAVMTADGIGDKT